jgi:UDP-glucose 4-epimerase
MSANELNGTTCFVAGAAGFIGSHLVDRLLAQGARVLGADNMVLGRKENLAKALQNPNFRFAQLDVNDQRACLEFLRQETHQSPITTVWHMAANSDIRAGTEDPEVDLRLTFLTTFNLLAVMSSLKVPQLVFASSSAIYGEHDGLLREEAGPLFPISNYGAMKLASEGLISAALERFLERVYICRFPNVIGSRMTHGVIFDFLKKLRSNSSELEVLGDGTQEKPYLHVSELVDAMVWVYQRSPDRLSCYNIAPQEGATTVRYIAESVVRAKAPGAAIRYTGGSKGWVGDVPRFNYSTEKLQALGWGAKLNSNDAVDLAVRESL